MPAPKPPAAPSRQKNAIQKTTEKPRFDHVLMVVLTLIIIAAGIFFWSKNKPANKPQVASNAGQIRQTFQVATGSVAGAFTPPAPNGIVSPLPASPGQSNQNLNRNISPRGAAGGISQSSQPNNPNQNQPSSSTLREQSYANSQFGFQLTMPAAWQANAAGSNIIAFFDSIGVETGYIEIYENSGNTTLDDIALTLQNSPDVSGVSRTTLSGQPALQFSANGQFTKGLAVIYNNRIYYLRGQLAEPVIRNGFKFI